MRKSGLFQMMFAGIAFLSGCGGGSDQAKTPNARPLYSWVGGKGGNLVSPSFDAVEGNLFKVIGGKPITVKNLGIEAKSALQHDGTTAIFDADGDILASATISPSDPLVNGYYYKAITPITLTSGSNYHIGSLHFTGADWSYYHDTNDANVPPYIEDLGTAAKISSTIEGGSWSNPEKDVRHYVGNFRAYVAP